MAVDGMLSDYKARFDEVHKGKIVSWKGVNPALEDFYMMIFVLAASSKEYVRPVRELLEETYATLKAHPDFDEKITQEITRRLYAVCDDDTAFELAQNIPELKDKGFLWYTHILLNKFDDLEAIRQTYESEFEGKADADYTVQNGPDPQNAMSFAAASGSIPLVEFLLEIGTTVYDSAIKEAKNIGMICDGERRKTQYEIVKILRAAKERQES